MIRVIFVDDEPDVLEGLENRLRPMRKSWKMRFANGSTEALAFLDEEPADVVVSDMRMPGIDGPSLFRHLERTHPRTIRIALSGQTNEESVVRTLGLAHQFLAKPATVDDLRAAIARTMTLQELLADKDLERLVRSIGQLPERPALYQELVALLDRRTPSLSEVAALVEGEAVVTARLLQLANSAFFGRTKPLTSVREAVSFLGLNAVRAILLSVELFDWAGSLARVSGSRLDELHAHGLEVAIVASRLMGDGESGVLAFTGGVLHDLGELVMGAAPPDVVEELEGRVSHADAGARLLALWGLPASLVEIVAHHHRPSRAGERAGLTPLLAVHLANVLVTELEGRASEATLDDVALEASGKAADLPAFRAIAEAAHRERSQS